MKASCSQFFPVNFQFKFVHLLLKILQISVCNLPLGFHILIIIIVFSILQLLLKKCSSLTRLQIIQLSSKYERCRARISYQETMQRSRRDRSTFTASSKCDKRQNFPSPMITRSTLSSSTFRPVFVQRLFIQGVFVQSYQVKIGRNGLDENRLDQNELDEKQVYRIFDR